MKKLAVMLVIFLAFCPKVFAEEIRISGEQFYNETAEKVKNQVTLSFDLYLHSPLYAVSFPPDARQSCRHRPPRQSG